MGVLMAVRNRLADISTLRCHVCQDYMRFILPSGWQQLVYQKAKSAVEGNKAYKNHYIAIYEKMRDIGWDNYRIEDMDVTIISELLHSCNDFIRTNPQVLKAIDAVRDDRNLIDHLGENEDPEELYLSGLLALCRLQSFIRAVDKFEQKNVSDENRLAYRQKYTSEINELKKILDEERIELIQKVKIMDHDIQEILQSETPLQAWIRIEDSYYQRYIKIDKNYDSYNEFEVRASDAGIIYAHKGAADYFIVRKNYDEVERRLFMQFGAFAGQAGSDSEMKWIVDTINHCLIKECPLREGSKELIENVKNEGYNISQREDGLYIWNKKIID